MLILHLLSIFTIKTPRTLAARALRTLNREDTDKCTLTCNYMLTTIDKCTRDQATHGKY